MISATETMIRCHPERSEGSAFRNLPAHSLFSICSRELINAGRPHAAFAFGFFFLRASELQSVCKDSNHREGMASAMPKEFCHSEMESAN